MISYQFLRPKFITTYLIQRMLVTEMIKCLFYSKPSVTTRHQDQFCHYHISSPTSIINTIDSTARNVLDTTTVANAFQTSSRYYQQYLTVKASPQHTCCRLGLVIHDDQVVFCLNPRLLIDDYDFDHYELSLSKNKLNSP